MTYHLTVQTSYADQYRPVRQTSTDQLGRPVQTMCTEYHIYVNMYHVSAQGVEERMINVHIIIIIIIMHTKKKTKKPKNTSKLRNNHALCLRTLKCYATYKL